MATKSTKAITNVSLEVLNAIRNSASMNYQNYVPYASADADSIKTIGNIIMDSPNLRNEFLDILMQRIALVTITSKTYDNPWAVFKRGTLEAGETIEEIFNGLVDVFEYDIETAEAELFKRVKPSVRSAFHTVNYKKFYKLTVEDVTLRGAFTSLSSLSDYIMGLISQVYTSANYDEFLVMKYLLGREALDGLMTSVSVPTVNSSNAGDVITVIKTISNELTFMKSKYNLAGVRTHTPKDRQYVLINTAFDAMADVNVLASAFNMDKVQFAGHKILLDSWADFDMTRLNMLMAEQTGYKAFTADELASLDTIPCFVVDKDFFMIYDRYNSMRDVENGQGLYRNYFYHTWKYVSRSPFANSLFYNPTEINIGNLAVLSSDDLRINVNTYNAAKDGDYLGHIDIWVGDIDFAEIPFLNKAWDFVGSDNNGYVRLDRAGNYYKMGNSTVGIETSSDPILLKSVAYPTVQNDVILVLYN